MCSCASCRTTSHLILRLSHHPLSHVYPASHPFVPMCRCASWSAAPTTSSCCWRLTGCGARLATRRRWTWRARAWSGLLRGARTARPRCAWQLRCARAACACVCYLHEAQGAWLAWRGACRACVRRAKRGSRGQGRVGSDGAGPRAPRPGLPSPCWVFLFGLACAQVLVRAAIQNGSHDNITVVLLDLEHPQADSQAQPAHQPHAHHPDLHLQHPVLVPVQCEGTPMQGEPGPVMCMPAVGAPAQPQAEVRHLDSAASHAQVEQAQAQQRRPAFTKPTLQLQGLPEPQLEPAEAAALQQLRQYPAASADAPMGLCPVLTPQGALQGCGGLGRLLEGGGVGAADAGSPPPLVWNTAAGAVNGPSGAADAMGHQGQGSVGGHYVEMVRSPYTRCVSLPSGVGNGSPTSSAPPTQPQGQGQAAPAQLPQQHHHQAHQLSRLGPAGGSPGHSPSAAAPAPEAFQPNGAGAPAAASAELAHPWGAHVAAQALAGGLAGSPLPQPHQPQLQLFAEHRSPRKRYKELEPAAEGPSNSSGSGSGSGTGSGTESGSPAGGVDEQGDEVDDGLRAVLVPLYLGVEDLAEPCCSPAHAAFSPAGGTPGAAAGAAAGRGLGSPFGGLDPFPERLLVSVQPAGSPRRTA